MEGFSPKLFASCLLGSMIAPTLALFAFAGCAYRVVIKSWEYEASGRNFEEIDQNDRSNQLKSVGKIVSMTLGVVLGTLLHKSPPVHQYLVEHMPSGYKTITLEPNK